MTIRLAVTFFNQKHEVSITELTKALLSFFKKKQNP